jgi:GH15 family glucan-1,4-alpha-glucosidase
LWEEKYGITTFTCATHYDALLSAGRFADLLGKGDEGKVYTDTAEKVRGAISNHFYNEERQMFYKLINKSDTGVITHDATIDISSFFGIVKFNVLDVKDERVRKSAETIEKILRVPTDVGGFMRYENDRYYKTHEHGPSNPWFVATLWMAQYYIQAAQTEADLKVVKELLVWAVKYALLSGVMSEQIDPYTGRQLSAAPLTWSHSEFVITVIDYLEKLEKMGICVACNPVK